MMPSALHADADSVVTDGTLPPGLREAFVKGRSHDQRSEDVIAVTSSHVAVFDGMSSPLRGADEPGSGRHFALAAAHAVLALPAGAAAVEAVRAIAAATARVEAVHAGPQGAVGAILSLERREVWRIGDVNVRVDGEQHPGSKRVDEVFTDFRAAIDLAAHLGGMSLDDVIAEDPGLAAASALLRGQPAFANRVGPFGYGVFDGTEVPEQFIETIRIPAGATVTLTTDGFPFSSADLAGAERALRAAMRRDPACIGELRAMGKPVHPGADAPDDRSFVQVVIE